MIVDIKSNEEIVGFKRAGYEAGRILRKLILHASPGWCGLDLDKIAKEECNEIGATPTFLNYENYPASICVSINSTLVHGIPNNEPFKRGDILSIDFGLTLDGFIGDTAETIIVNYSSPCFEYSKLISECRFALWSAIKRANPKNKLSDISRAIETIAKSNNFKVPKEYGGHGVSRNKMHASPFIPNYYDEHNDITLRKGMVLAIEPMFIDAISDELIIADDRWAVIAQGNTAHFEHTILITDDEPVVLTDCSGKFLSGKIWSNYDR